MKDFWWHAIDFIRYMATVAITGFALYLLLVAALSFGTY